jgi:hypothetical protein
LVPPNTTSASMTVKGVPAVGSFTTTANGDNLEEGGFAAVTLTSLLYMRCPAEASPRRESIQAGCTASVVGCKCKLVSPRPEPSYV